MKYIFGAAFDPITRAHIAIIKSVAKHMTKEDELVIMVSNNDEKNYPTAIKDRFEVVNATLEKNIDCEYMLIQQDKRTYAFLQEHFFKQENDITIIVGEDEWKALTDYKWHNAIDLLATYKFIVVGRENSNVDTFNYNARVINIDMPNCASSAVRKIFDLNPDTKYKEVNTYITLETFKQIKENGLYHQNGDRYYEDECPELLAAYKVKAEKNHWGKVSATTDTVIYNGTKVLLIRRKNWPYRNFWALPGGFFEATDADLNYGAAREVQEETGLNYEPENFKMIKTYGHDFDPRMKIVDTAFALRVHKKDMNKAVGADDAAEARWFDLTELPKLAFHHEMIIKDWMANNE